jgi:lysozyme
MNKLLPEAEKLVKEFEGCSLVAYKDMRGVWTDGWGNTHNVIPGSSISQAQADLDLESNLQMTAASVARQVKIPLTDQQFSALVVFTFNEGVGHLHELTAPPMPFYFGIRCAEMLLRG